MFNRLTETWQRFIDVSQKDAEAVFTRIYRRNRWGGGESASGPGSSREQTASFVPLIIEMIGSLDTRVLLDVPCGDMNWIGEVADSVDEYIGIDIVRDLIDRNIAQHSKSNRKFMRANMITDPLPRADVVLCRDGLVHLSNEDVWKAIRNIKRSESRFLLTTTFVDRAGNKPIPTGSWRPLNLEREPFCFESPSSLIDERCLHTNGIYRDKRLALWDLASVPDGPATRTVSRT